MAKLGTTKTGRGDRNKRLELKKTKILEDNLLFEDEEADADANEDDEFEGFAESEAEELEEMLVYKGELVSEEEWEEGNVFVPRSKLQAYMLNEGNNIKTRGGEGKKFTRGTDPRVKEIMNFMTDENINCP